MASSKTFYLESLFITWHPVQTLSGHTVFGHPEKATVGGFMRHENGIETTSLRFSLSDSERDAVFSIIQSAAERVISELAEGQADEP